MMYSRLLSISIQPGSEGRILMEQIANQALDISKTQKGFRGITFLGDEATGKYASLSLWETKQDLEVASQGFAERIMQALQGKVVGKPSIDIMEVYEPKV